MQQFLSLFKIKLRTEPKKKRFMTWNTQDDIYSLLFAKTLKFPSSNLTMNLKNLKEPASKLQVYKTKYE